jgi:hypothetical protein
MSEAAEMNCRQCSHWIESVWDNEEGDSWGYCSWRDDPLLGMTVACEDYWKEVSDESHGGD